MKLRKINKKLFKRYLNILRNEDLKKEQLNIVYKLSLMGIKNIKELPVDKSSRWLGFVQGVLFSFNLINLEEERNFSRILFQKHYKKKKKNVKTYDIKDIKCH